MNTIHVDLLLKQAKAYVILSRSLSSLHYLNKAKECLNMAKNKEIDNITYIKFKKAA